MNEKYEILKIKLGNFLTLCLAVSFKKYKDNTYILKNDKMDFEYYTEEKNREKAKKLFAESIIIFLNFALKEGQKKGNPLKWLEDWGFEKKENDNEAFKLVWNYIKMKNENLNVNKINNLINKNLTSNYNWGQ